MPADGTMSFLADQNSHLQPTTLSSKSVCEEASTVTKENNGYL